MELDVAQGVSVHRACAPRPHAPPCNRMSLPAPPPLLRAIGRKRCWPGVRAEYSRLLARPPTRIAGQRPPRSGRRLPRTPHDQSYALMREAEATLAPREIGLAPPPRSDRGCRYCPAVLERRPSSRPSTPLRSAPGWPWTAVPPPPSQSRPPRGGARPEGSDRQFGEQWPPRPRAEPTPSHPAENARSWPFWQQAGLTARSPKRSSSARSTASFHVATIKGKLGSRSRVEIATDAIGLGLIDVPQRER